MAASQETPEIRRDLQTIAIRLETFKGIKSKIAEIPDEIRPADADAIAREANMMKIYDSLRNELKADLKWLFDWDQMHSQHDQAVALFVGILEVI